MDKLNEIVNLYIRQAYALEELESELSHPPDEAPEAHQNDFLWDSHRVDVRCMYLGSTTVPQVLSMGPMLYIRKGDSDDFGEFWAGFGDGDESDANADEGIVQIRDFLLETHQTADPVPQKMLDAVDWRYAAETGSFPSKEMLQRTEEGERVIRTSTLQMAVARRLAEIGIRSIHNCWSTKRLEGEARARIARSQEITQSPRNIGTMPPIVRRNIEQQTTRA